MTQIKNFQFNNQKIHNSNIIAINKNGTRLAILVYSNAYSRNKNKIEVYDISFVNNKSPIFGVTLSNESITKMKWSFDSKFLFTFNNLSSFIEIIDIENESVRKHEFNEKIVFSTLLPLSYYFVSITEFKLKLNISIFDKKIHFFVKFPKFENSNCFDYNPIENYFIVAERKNDKDFLTVYDSDDLFKIMSNFSTQSDDLISIKCSKKNNLICVLDSEFDSKALIYTIEGSLLKIIKKNPSYFSHCIWSNLDHLFLIDSENTIFLFDFFSIVIKNNNYLIKIKNKNKTKKCFRFKINQFPSLIMLFSKLSNENNNNKLFFSQFLPNLFVEVDWDYLQGIRSKNKRSSNNFNNKTKYINTLENNLNFNENTNFNIKKICFSFDSKYLSFVILKKVILIFKINKSLSLNSIIIQKNNISNLNWALNEPKLYFTSQSNCFYFWDENGCGICDFLTDFEYFGVKPIKCIRNIKNKNFLFQTKNSIFFGKSI